MHPSSIPCRAIPAIALAWSLSTTLPAAEPAHEHEAPDLDLSVDVMLVAGASTADDHELEELQAGGHDPRRSGLRLQQAELSLLGTAGDRLKGEAHIIFLEDETELEEAFATAALPTDLELKAGYFLTEFGLLNPEHPHAQAWIDQPVVTSRLLGGGLRGAGARLAWSPDAPWSTRLLLGVQNADDDSATGFLGEGHRHGDERADEDAEHGDEEHEETLAGWPRTERETDSLDDLLWLARWENGPAADGPLGLRTGLSALYGPNATGDDGQTLLYGADLTLSWPGVCRHDGGPFVAWRTEAMKREARTDDAVLSEDGEELALDGVTIADWGLYSQVVCGFGRGWEAGLRVDYASGNDRGIEERDDDPARSDRWRVSPMLAYRPSAYTRIRLQYNRDEADFLDETVHTVWAGFEFRYGAAHPHDHRHP